MLKLIKNNFLFKSLQPLQCSGGSDGGLAAAESARKAEEARLNALKAQEQEKILKDTIAEKTTQANAESSKAAARATLLDKPKASALEDPTQQKQKTLLKNYS